MAKLSSDADDVYKYEKTDFEATDVETDKKIRTSALRFYRKLQKVNDQDIKYMSAIHFGKISALITGLSSIFVIWVSAWIDYSSSSPNAASTFADLYSGALKIIVFVILIIVNKHYNFLSEKYKLISFSDSDSDKVNRSIMKN